MRSATARRLALVAAIILLAPLWAQPVATAVERPGAVFVRLAAPAPAPGPAIRRNVTPASWALGSRPDYGRGLVLAAVLALLGLVAFAPWTSLTALPSGPSSLARRRHAISLRAPPLPDRS